MKFHSIPFKLAKKERERKQAHSWQEMGNERREGLSSIPNVNVSYYSFFGKQYGKTLIINIRNICTLQPKSFTPWGLVL